MTSLHQTVDRAAAALPAENLVAIFRELGTIYQSTLVQPYDAIDAWRRLLGVDPRDFEAMAALENLLRAEERWVEVIDVKMGRAQAYEDAQEKIAEMEFSKDAKQKDRIAKDLDAVAQQFELRLFVFGIFLERLFQDFLGLRVSTEIEVQVGFGKRIDIIDRSGRRHRQGCRR